ncbi:MAG: TonB-dependent receptor [Acidobacteria bacterium]|nr:TonB-dependent receptor [Acidobacteriota bacterium]
MKRLVGFTVATLFVLVGAAEVAGQSPSAGLRGTVRDAAGVVPGATVILVNEETSARRSTVTTDVGEYLFPDVSPGTYTVTVSVSGYKTFENKGIPIRTDMVTVDASLELGGLTEEVVVVGTRRTDRTVGNSPTPIDVLPGDVLVRQGASNLNDALRTQVVSLNVQRFVAQDGAAFIRPFSLRGLPADQTLVLVNGKRRHRSALVQITNQPLSAGAQGPDLSTIPSIAVEHVEVLRDGAAAQYGSEDSTPRATGRIIHSKQTRVFRSPPQVSST